MSKNKKIYKISGNLSNGIDLSGLNNEEVSSMQSGAIIIPAEVFNHELRKGTLIDFISNLITDIESINDDINEKEDNEKHYIATYNYKSEKDRDGSIILNPDSIIIPNDVIRDTLSKDLLYQLSDFLIRVPVEIKNELSDKTLSYLTNFLNSLVNDLGIKSNDSDTNDDNEVEMIHNQIVNGRTLIEMRSFAENIGITPTPKIISEPIQGIMEYKGDRKWMKKLIKRSIHEEVNTVYKKLDNKLDDILSQIYGIDDSICDNHSENHEQLECMNHMFNMNLDKMFDIISAVSTNKSTDAKSNINCNGNDNKSDGPKK